MDRQLPVILLVEDDVADIELTRVALSGCRVPHELEAVMDGRQALARIQNRTPYEHRRRPSLVLLDLGVPRLNGLDLLRELKASEGTRAIPVVVFSGLQTSAVVSQAYACHANAFIQKPGDLRRLTAALCLNAEYWLEQVTPSQS